MPSVSDPGYLIVRQALDAGLKVEVIPGVSALTTALAGSGLPTDEFMFLGFAPSRTGERKRWLAAKVGSGGRNRRAVRGARPVAGPAGRPGSGLWRSVRRGSPRTDQAPRVLASRMAVGTDARGRCRQPSQTAASSLFWYLTKNRPLLTRSDSQSQTRVRSRRCSSKSVKTPTSAGARRSNRVAASFSLSNRAVYAIVERMKDSGK